MQRTPLIPILLSLLAMLTLALWLRLPEVGKGLPYFHDEDEAHHFNRTVEMVKSGDFNPHYFLKPSLHFYLRIPAVAAGFLREAQRGGIKSPKELKTRDPEGLSGYSFSASHPSIAKAARIVSLVLSVGVVLLTYLVAINLGLSPLPALGAAFLVTLSAPLLSYSGTVGVDMLVTFMSLLTVYVTLPLLSEFTLGRLLGAGLLAGLTISSKYNAAPIAFVPLLALLLSGHSSVTGLLSAVIAPVLGFLLGTPYLLASFPLFLEHLGYEAWHYKSGHQGFSAEPGIPQLLFYSRWLSAEALGYGAACAALVGAVLMLVARPARGSVFLLMPLLFAMVMVDQRTNFTRNMLLLLPFAAILAAWAVVSVASRFPAPSRRAVMLALFVAMLIQPARGAFAHRSSSVQLRDTRSEVREWLLATNGVRGTAVDRQLQCARDLVGEPGVDTIDLSRHSAETLLLSGYRRVVVPAALTLGAPWVLEHSLEGAALPMRVVASPALSVYRAPEPLLREQIPATIDELKISARSWSLAGCSSADEPYCWLSSRAQRLVFVDPPEELRRSATVRLSLELMSPWSNQRVEFLAGDRRVPLKLPQDAWEKVVVSLPKAAIEGTTVLVSEALSPRVMKTGSDERRLGVAIRSVRLEPLHDAPQASAVEAVPPT